MPAWLGLRTAGACLVAFGLLGIGVSVEGGLGEADATVESRLARLDDPTRDRLLWLSSPGELWVAAALAAAGIAACLALGSRRNAMLMLLAVPLDLSARLLKLAFGVPRPDGSDGLGFPSAHAARAVGVLGLALLLVHASWRRRAPGRPPVPAWAIAAWLLVGATAGAGRALGGVHWASDVLGGLAWGLAFAAAANHWAQRSPLAAPRSGPAEASKAPQA